MTMRVLVACEFSGIVRDAFAARGHDAWSCDLLPSEGKTLGQRYPHLYPPGHQLHDRQQHYQCDIFELFNGRVAHSMRLENQGLIWDLMIAHPPCTYLTVTANRWNKDQPARASGKLVGAERRAAREQAIEFFMALANLPVEKICIENPIGCMSKIWMPPTQIVHPYYWGDATTKATCLWLKSLPPLHWAATDDLFQAKTTVAPEIYTSKTGKKYPKWSMIDACKIKDLDARSHFRSKTFQGIANAMAEQWGGK